VQRQQGKARPGWSRIQEQDGPGNRERAHAGSAPHYLLYWVESIGAGQEPGRGEMQTQADADRRRQTQTQLGKRQTKWSRRITCRQEW
jgi:hypothetical protein